MKREEKSIEYHLERIKKLKKQYEEEYKKQIDLEVKSIPSKDLDSFIKPKTVMKREQTAVEWLQEQFFFISRPDIFAQAKQMEKKQIINAYKADCETLGNDDTFNNEAEKYYESKYGKDENKTENND